MGKMPRIFYKTGIYRRSGIAIDVSKTARQLLAGAS
jgi:hypothetical protein